MYVSSKTSVTYSLPFLYHILGTCIIPDTNVKSCISWKTCISIGYILKISRTYYGAALSWLRKTAEEIASRLLCNDYVELSFLLSLLWTVDKRDLVETKWITSVNWLWPVCSTLADLIVRISEERLIFSHTNTSWSGFQSYRYKNRYSWYHIWHDPALWIDFVVNFRWTTNLLPPVSYVSIHAP